MNLTSRVSKLEDATVGGVTVMWRHHYETDEQAIDRWRVEHPGQVPDDLKVILIKWADLQPEPFRVPQLGVACGTKP
ncbi:MAG: hypothetical protein KA171_21885 [Reyranella sp.]|nr:hypothetical protein [Reyranella sp.]